MKAYYYTNHKGEPQSLFAHMAHVVRATSQDDYDYKSVAFYDENGQVIRIVKAVSDLISEELTKYQLKAYELQEN